MADINAPAATRSSVVACPRRSSACSSAAEGHLQDARKDQEEALSAASAATPSMKAVCGRPFRFCPDALRLLRQAFPRAQAHLPRERRHRALDPPAGFAAGATSTRSRRRSPPTTARRANVRASGSPTRWRADTACRRSVCACWRSARRPTTASCTASTSPRKAARRRASRCGCAPRSARQVVAFKSFLRTLVHEFGHHLDYEMFKLQETFHTEGFYKRESRLANALIAAMATPPLPPRGAGFGPTAPVSRLR